MNNKTKAELAIESFKFNKSLPKILIKKAMGVTTVKKTTPITIGETIFPRINPNLNQVLFKGVKIIAFINPKTRNIIATNKDHVLIFPSLKIGQIEINKKTIKNTIPKLLFELIFISLIYTKDF